MGVCGEAAAAGDPEGTGAEYQEGKQLFDRMPESASKRMRDQASNRMPEHASTPMRDQASNRMPSHS